MTEIEKVIVAEVQKQQIGGETVTKVLSCTPVPDGMVVVYVLEYANKYTETKKTRIHCMFITGCNSVVWDQVVHRF